MVEVINYEVDFLKLYKQEPRDIIAYGAGKCFLNNYMKLPTIDCVCDINAKQISNAAGFPVYLPKKIKEYEKEVYIVVFNTNQDTFEEICKKIDEYAYSAKIVCFKDNIAFGYCYGATFRSYRKTDDNTPIIVNLVCQEKTWIYKKFADNMYKCLRTEDIKVMISENTRKDVNINHHIACLNFEPFENDTLFITHIDDWKKIHLLKKQLEIARLGICMSKETVNKLILLGIPAYKLCYINPAHDHIIKPKKYVIGITHRCYDKYDLRKRTNALLDILEGVNPDYFKFAIMGSGWEWIVSEMEQRGFEVDYCNDFNKERYCHLMNEIDYYFFMGFDEGSMGYLDALAAGVGTIVTPQGFHLDTECKIDYPCRTVKQFHEAFMDLQKKREQKINAVSDWTWKNYSLKHLEIWNYILKRKDLSEIYRNQLLYEDGIFSVMLDDCRI